MCAAIFALTNSQVTVLESWTGTQAGYFNNATTELHAADNAQVEHVKFQDEHTGAFHVGGLHTTLGRDARVAHHSLALGGRIARNNLRAHLNGTGIEAVLNGLTCRAGQLIDHMVVNHAQPHCDSHEYFNGILDDDSRAVFHDRTMHKGADKRTRSRPIKTCCCPIAPRLMPSRSWNLCRRRECTHGATIGQMNAEQFLWPLGTDEEPRAG